MSHFVVATAYGAVVGAIVATAAAAAAENLCHGRMWSCYHC